MLTLAAEIPTPLNWAWLIPTLPFVGMLVCGLAGALRLPALRNLTGWITVGIVAAGFAVTMAMLPSLRPQGDEGASHSAAYIVPFFDWIQSGNFIGDFSFYIDTLTIVMLIVVTGVGTLIAAYAAWYMAGDPGYWRFFAYINLFIFAMT